ncbi:MAG: tetratricopeptide repeat-containing serine protease family protein [Candidatus Poribacteria bacterium]|nr:tetratricopeptide repeat-containing serine protease family protein [Candidatus Poribacteria bacterium]
MQNSPTVEEFSNYDAGIAAYERGHYEMAMYDFEQRAVVRNDPVAQFCLGFMYKHGLGVPPDPRRAIEWYTKAAKQGYMPAQNDLGVIYGRIGEQALLLGEESGIEMLIKALKWFHDAGNQGNPAAQFNAALMCRLTATLSLAVSFSTNPTKTGEFHHLVVSWNEKAASQNYPPAQYELATIYRTGSLGTTKDAKRALELLTKAATPNPNAALRYKNGYPLAQHDLATMYARDGNFTEAVKWYQMAAIQVVAARGVAESQFHLGLAYHKGDGVNQDIKEAAKWYQMAADRGYPSAQNSLSVLYSEGTGVPYNPEMASRLAFQAAQQGNAIAQANIGKAFAEGLEGLDAIPQDDVEAYYWYSLAIKDKASLDKAQDPNFATEASEAFETVGHKLTKDQKNAIRKRVNEWKPRILYGSGTGFYINKTHVLTNAHVVRWEDDYGTEHEFNEVRLGFRYVKEKLSSADSEIDLALLIDSSQNTETATFRSHPVDLGEEIAVFGYPLSSVLSYRGNGTSGRVSGLTSTIDDLQPDNRFQHTAPTQKGNSGGPVLNTAGNVIGVVVSALNPFLRWKGDQIRIEDRQNVNFAIKFNIIKEFLEKNNVTGYAVTENLSNPINLKEIYVKAEKFTVPVLGFVNKPEMEPLQFEEIGIDRLELVRDTSHNN